VFEVGSHRVNKRILTTLIGSGAMDCLGDRAKLFLEIDRVLKRSDQIAERRQSQMKDLFSEDEMLVTKEKEDNKETEVFDLTSSEWSSLGFYLESHPIENRMEEVRSMCGLLISELEVADFQQRVAGVLMQINVRQGSKGRFAFATIDDSTSKLEVSIWPDVLEKHRRDLKKGQIIV
jgi:DNA polymerase-3 subunit alpha